MTYPQWRLANGVINVGLVAVGVCLVALVAKKVLAGSSTPKGPAHTPPTTGAN